MFHDVVALTHLNCRRTYQQLKLFSLQERYLSPMFIYANMVFLYFNRFVVNVKHQPDKFFHTRQDYSHRVF
jgi:hypothetical protein